MFDGGLEYHTCSRTITGLHNNRSYSVSPGYIVILQVVKAFLLSFKGPLSNLKNMQACKKVTESIRETQPLALRREIKLPSNMIKVSLLILISTS